MMTTWKPKYILWLDPGETTGWALWYLAEQRLYSEEYSLDTIGTYLERWLSTGGKETVLGCEQFIVTTETAQLTQQPASLKVIGMAEMLVTKYPVVSFHVDQTSSTAKTFCSNRILKALGWYQVSRPHANDAARHLFVYLAKHHMLSRDLKERAFGDLQST